MTAGHGIILLVLGIVGTVNYLRYRDVMYPPVIQTVVWTGVLLLYWLNQEMFYAVSPLVYVIIVSGVVLFSVGSYLATQRHRVQKLPLEQVDFTPKDWYRNLLFWLPLIGIIPFSLKAWQLGQYGPFDNFYMNLRTALITDDSNSPGGPYGLAAYLVTVSFASVMLQTLFAEYRTHTLRYAVSLLVALTYAVFSTGRTFFLLLMISTAGVLLMTRRVQARQVLAVGGAVFLAIFIAIGVITGRAGGADGFSYEAMDAVADVLVMYAVSPLPAFDLHIQSHDVMEWGQNVFRTPLAILSFIGFDVPVQPIIQEFEFVPIPTNVYTFYRSFYDDFGMWGVLLIPILAGLFHGYLYRRATQGQLIFIVAYALSLFPLVMQFYDDTYQSLSLWVQYAVLLFVYFYRLRIVSPEPDQPLATVQPA